MMIQDQFKQFLIFNDECLRLKLIFFHFINYLISVNDSQHRLGIFDLSHFLFFFESNCNLFFTQIQELRVFESKFETFISNNKEIFQSFKIDYSLFNSPTTFAMNICELYAKIQDNHDITLNEIEILQILKDDYDSISNEINALLDCKQTIINKLKELKKCYLCSNQNIGLFTCNACKKPICELHRFNDYCINCAKRILDQQKQRV